MLTGCTVYRFIISFILRWQILDALILSMRKSIAVSIFNCYTIYNNHGLLKEADVQLDKYGTGFSNVNNSDSFYLFDMRFFAKG